MTTRKSNNFKFTRHQLDTYNPKEAILQREFKDTQKAMRYIKRMLQIVEYYKQNPSYNTTTELHHIVPVTWGGPDCENNVVSLPLKVHIVVHHLLAKTQDVSMIRAFCALIDFVKDTEFAYNITINQIVDACKLRNQVLSCPIFLIETEQLFPSMREASRWVLKEVLKESYNDFDAYNTRIQAIMNSISSAAKRHRSAYGLHWILQKDVTKPLKEHLDDFIKEKTDIRSKADRCRIKAIINLNTGERFDAVIDAANHYGVKRMTLADAARRGYRSAGCFWIYEDELIAKNISVENELKLRELQYKQNFENSYNRMKKTINSQRAIPVINLTTSREYNSIAEACAKEHVQSLSSRINEYNTKRYVYCNNCFWIRKQDLRRSIEDELAIQQKNRVEYLQRH